MPSIILSDNGVSSGSAGLKSTAASDGALSLQTTTAGGTATTAISIDTSQNVTFTNQPTYSGGTANGVAYLNGSKVLTTGSALVFDGSNLGLGVTPSAWNSVYRSLQLGSTAAVSGRTDSNLLELSSNSYRNSGGGWTYLTTSSAARYDIASGVHNWYYAASGTAGNAITFTQAMTLDASGNLGIGTTSPAGKLDVAGTIAISPGNAPARIRRTTVNGSYGVQIVGNTNDTRSDTYPGASIYAGGGPITGDAYAGNIELVAYGNLTDSTSNIINFQRRTGVNTVAESARIDSSGNLLVGTTSTFSGAKFSVNGSNTDFISAMENTSGTTPAGLRIKYTGVSGGTGGAFLYLHDTNALRCQVAGNGNVTNANNSYGSTSDVKLKENIVDATPKLEQLTQVRVVNYNFIGDEQKQLGVIAQELEQVFPAMVEETQDRDADGNDLGTTTKSVKYSVFVPMLIKAIQEQQSIIQQLQADVAALKGAQA